MTREQAIEIIRQHECNSEHYEACEMAIGALEQQPKTGQWILSGGYWRCSNCNEKALLKLDKAKGGCREYAPIKSNFCPNCGRKMEVEE